MLSGPVPDMASKSTLLLLGIFLLFTAEASSYDEQLTVKVDYAGVPPVKPVSPAPPVPVKPPASGPSVPVPPVVKKPPTPAPPPVKVAPAPLPPPPLKPPVTPAPPVPIIKSPNDCSPLCDYRCKLHSRKRVCKRACVTCCIRCKCVPPGTYGNREKCGTCYTSMVTHGNRPKCP